MWPRSSHTRDAIELGQDQVVAITRDGVQVTRFDGEPADVQEYHVDWDAAAAEKGGYDHFMLKEIAEQPRAVADTLLGRLAPDGTLLLDEMRLSDQELRDIDKIIIIACGTAYHSGLIAKYAVEHWTRIPCEIERLGVPLPRPHPRPADTRRRDLPVRRDHGHADGGAARPGAGIAGARHL